MRARKTAISCRLSATNPTPAGKGEETCCSMPLRSPGRGEQTSFLAPFLPRPPAGEALASFSLEKTLVGIRWAIDRGQSAGRRPGGALTSGKRPRRSMVGPINGSDMWSAIMGEPGPTFDESRQPPTRLPRPPPIHVRKDVERVTAGLASAVPRGRFGELSGMRLSTLSSSCDDATAPGPWAVVKPHRFPGTSRRSLP